MKNEGKTAFEKKVFKFKENLKKDYSSMIEEIFKKEKNQLITLEKSLLKSLPNEILNCPVEYLQKNNFNISKLINPKVNHKICSQLQNSILNKRKFSINKKLNDENYDNNKKFRFATPIKKKRYFYTKNKLKSFSQKKHFFTEFKEEQKKRWKF